LEIEVFRNKLLIPLILGKVVLEDQLGIVAVTEEVGLGNGLYFRVKKLERMFVGELDHSIL
jgi:hypothetical protein